MSILHSGLYTLLTCNISKLKFESIPLLPIDMEQVRTAVGLGSLDGKLYAVGGECEATGHEGTLYLKSVECFDPRVNSWSRIPDMQYARSFAAVASFNGKC